MRRHSSEEFGSVSVAIYCVGMMRISASLAPGCKSIASIVRASFTPIFRVPELFLYASLGATMHPYFKEVRMPMLAQKTSKNQLTLPQDIVKEFPGIEYFDVSVVKRKIVLLPVRMARADTDLKAIQQKLEKLGVLESDVPDAVQWARKRRKR